MMDDVFSDKSMQKGKDRSSLLINGATTKVEDLLNELGTSEQGLTEDVVKEHLAKYGSNTYPEKKKNPFMIVWAQFKNLFNILLIMAAALSFISGIMSNAQSSINMGIVILLIVFLSILFNLIQEQRAERAVRSIQQLVPMNAKVMRSGQEKLTPIQDIVPGDIIILEEGDRVPADARVINSFDLSVDNSALTGESDPQPRRSIEESEDEELFQYSNLVFAGTTVVSGTGTVVVILTGEYTQFGSIIGLTRSTKAPPSPLQKDINHAARLNFIVAMLVGLVFLFAAYFILHLDLAASLLFMIGVMVSLVPEGFQIIMTLSLALSSVAMSKRNVVVKRLASVETLGSVTTICTDKTGTITEGQMTARWMWISGDRLKITGEGYEPGGMVFLDEKKLMASDREDLQLMAYASALDNTATLVPPLGHGKSRWTAVGDPTEAALLVMSTKCGVNYKDELKKKKRIGMIPFESSRKMMTSVHEEDEGRYVAYVKGASAELLARSINIYWNGKIIPLTPDIKEQITTQADSFAREAFRVLAIAVRNFSEVPTHFESEKIENQLTFVGLIALYDPPRAETKDAVAKAQHAGIRIIMLTGDHELTAGSIARKVGIISTDDSQVISGHALENMSDENLSLLLDNKELVFARVAPAQKLRIVNLLKSKGETVAVTGDGVNDSPALLGADIGIAMGLTGTDVAKESADMILMDDNFASIVNGVEEGRTVFDNLRKFVVYVFTHNWGELMAFVAFVLLGTPLPLAIIQVLAIDLLMEIPPSLALTTEPPEPGIMLRPPRPKDSRLFNISALSRSMYIGIIVGAYVLFWCFNIWSGGGWSLGSNTVPDHDIYLQGTTAVMIGIMAGQVGMLLATRTNVHSALSIKLSRNKWILRSIGISMAMLLIITYVPPAQVAFLSQDIPLIYWPILFAIAPVVFFLEEFRKAILRRTMHPEVISPELSPKSAKVSLDLKKYRARDYEEKAPPIVIILTGMRGESNAIIISAAMSEHFGSRLILIQDPSTDYDRMRHFERIVKDLTDRKGISIEYLKLDRSELLNGLEQIRDTLGITMIVVPVNRSKLLSKGGALKDHKWIASMSSEKIILIDGASKAGLPLLTDSPRIIIPLIGKIRREPFEIANAMSAHRIFPHIDVVVDNIDEIVPASSHPTYKIDSYVDAHGKYSVARFILGERLHHKIRSLFILTKRAERDLTIAMRDRKIDVVILGGDWRRHHEHLSKEERNVAKDAPAVLIITLPTKRRHYKMVD